MANETSGRRDNRVPFRASTKTPNIMMLRRTRFLLIVCGILAFAVLGIKLFNVMIVHHDEYEKMAIDQQVRTTEITASRGAIYDTNGKILAMNASVDTIFISPAEIVKNKEDPQLIARELSEILDVDYGKILAMTKNTDRWYEVVKRKVEPEVSEKVRAFKKENNLTGVKIEPDTKRYYPYGNLAAHVIGFVGQDNNGLYGLEQRYDSYLTGSAGRIIRATDNRGTDMLFVNYEDYYDETKGDDMNLTIDATIQYYLEKHLQQAVEDYDVQNGAAAIAMDPNSGAILGMVSLGNFDLNDYQKVSDKDQEAIDAETNPDKKAEMLSAAQTKQWRNKALSDTYEPGSTFKPCTAVAALESGVITPSTTILDRGIYDYYSSPQPRCWIYSSYGSTHGRVDVSEAITVSCNYFFYEVGRLTGIKTLDDYATQFGLGQYTGIEIGGPNSAEAKGALASPEYAEANDLEWSDGQTLTAAIGQSYNLFTPLQLANYIATLVGNGEHYAAHLLKNVKTYNNSAVVYAYDKDPVNVVEMQDSTVEAIKTGMHDLTTGSLSTYFSKCVVSAGAKTGTAETGVTDANNMGAAMAPAAAATLLRYLTDTNTQPQEFDAICTGDLGHVGSQLFRELLAAEGLLLKNHVDCGSLLYDAEGQSVHSGASGPGCCAAVLCGHLLPRLERRGQRRVLFLATGALMSQTTFLQKESIPAISHLVELAAPEEQNGGNT